MLRSITLIASILIASAAGALEPGLEREHISYSPDRKFTFKITEEDIRKSPKWKNEDENPPLSARRALMLANALKKELSDRTGAFQDSRRFKWELKSIQFVPWYGRSEGDWYWLVRYERNVREYASTGVPADLEIPVLMDGTAVKPEITPYRPQ